MRGGLTAPQNSTTICHKCGAECNPEWNNCVKCGYPLRPTIISHNFPTVKCANCGLIFSAGYSNCPKCGKSVGDTGTRPKFSLFTKIVISGFALLVFCCVVSMCGKKESNNTSNTTPTSEHDGYNGDDTTSDEGSEYPVTDVEVNYGEDSIDDFFYDIVDDTVVLNSCNTHRSTVTIHTTYDISGKTYTTDISSFQVGNGSVETIIFAEGITEVATAVFNGSNVHRVFFPKSMTNVYDYTLSYLYPESDGEKIKIYYAGTQSEWSNIFTEYKRTGVFDAQGAEEKGAALADKLNELMGSEYDSSLFEYYFDASLEDLID